MPVPFGNLTALVVAALGLLVGAALGLRRRRILRDAATQPSNGQPEAVSRAAGRNADPRVPDRQAGGATDKRPTTP